MLTCHGCYVWREQDLGSTDQTMHDLITTTIVRRMAPRGGEGVGSTGVSVTSVV